MDGKKRNKLYRSIFIIQNKFRFYGRGAGSVKNIISAIENDKEDFLDDFK